ncbi:class I SAM-dependent methyltransferase [Thermoplasmatales archaeon AK]|nr:class I SAM-dependent methyltransferase [Thermoplasmatales archaeon AK]
MKIKNIRFKYYSTISWLVSKSLFRKFIAPTLSDFSEYNITENPEDIILKLLGREVPKIIREEYSELQKFLQSKYNSLQLKYPLNYRVEANTSFFIYSFVRLYQPLKMVETGVANGHSTFFILNALNKNGKGKLYSIDINSNVGSLVTDDLKQNWELIILPQAKKKNLEDILKKLYPINIFIHDSNHLYYWQELEFNLAFEYVGSQGYIMSDDVDSSHAFLDFINRKELNAFILFDFRKMFGIAAVK